MRLTSFLRLPGGIPEQGRPVSFRLRFAGPDNVPQVKTVAGQLLPLSQVEMAAVKCQAAEYCAMSNSLPLGEEELVRLLQASLRDADNPRVRLVEDETDMQALRAGLVAPQFDLLMAEYRELIDTEYPALATPEEEEALRREAAGFSGSAQPARG